MHMIYKYTHWECMLNVFIHGGVGGQKSLRSIVIAQRQGRSEKTQRVLIRVTGLHLQFRTNFLGSYRR